MSNDQILFVDDEDKVLAALNRELQEEGYEIFLANSGEAAMQLLERNPCKVIVADIKMPLMNGFELLDMVNEFYPDTIRIVLSGHADLNLILGEVNKRGIDRYLTKPWEPDELKMILRQAIELFNLRREVEELKARIAAEE